MLALPWCSKGVPQNIKSHPTIGPTWNQCRKCFPETQISPFPSPIYPVVGNLAFPPGMIDPILNKCINTLQARVQGFIEQNNWRSVEGMGVDLLGLNLSYLNRLQLANFFRSLPEAKKFNRKLTLFEKECIREDPISHTISKCYFFLTLPNRTTVQPR